MATPTLTEIQTAVASGWPALAALALSNPNSTGTLTGSLHCSNCNNVTNCLRCNWTDDSSGCTDCTAATGQHNSHLTDCTGCKRCSYCTNCTYLTNSHYSTGCHGVSSMQDDSSIYNMVIRSTNCRQCSRIMFCDGLSNAANMICNTQVSQALFTTAYNAALAANFIL